eukprot:TRINITY_DN11520_c0_g3_i2.p1 TRINITY_DN11520_c0_g3~~TRINITY_DN11520_c0_g3_i2.p1  ORF type:complete len:229 (+),score=51.20 TRINITY_DN11520_c0_g3_i2:43-687(+)
MSFKSFVTENELADIKKKRQEEWEKTRRPDQPLERPEEPYETRSLFEQLQANKAKKDEEFESARMYKNQIYSGMDDDEYQFVQELEQKQIEEEDKRWQEEGQQLQQFRAARELPSDDVEPVEKKPSKVKRQVGASQTKSQKQLLKGLIKRKGAGEASAKPTAKKSKPADTDSVSTAAEYSNSNGNASKDQGAMQTAGNTLASLIGDYGSDEDSD